MLPLRGAAHRPLRVVLAVALFSLLSFAPVVAMPPVDDPSPPSPAPPPSVEPVSVEQLVPATPPQRPAQPAIEPAFVPRPTVTAVATPVPAVAPATMAAPSAARAEPAAGNLDPAVDGTTRSNFPWGAGTASWYGPGGGVAMHYCSWAYRNSVGCGQVRITSLTTGLSVVAPVVDYCQCYWGTAQQRVVDLQTGLLAPLGLDSSAGLYQVRIEPVD